MLGFFTYTRLDASGVRIHLNNGGEAVAGVHVVIYEQQCNKFLRKSKGKLTMISVIAVIYMIETERLSARKQSKN